LSPIKVPPNATLDAFLAQSASLLTAADDLTSCLYAPQELDIVNAELTAVVSTVRHLQVGVQEFFPIIATVGEQFATLRLSDESSRTDKGGGKKDPRMWFETCFEQIYKISRSFALVENSAQTIP
jgi:hypothetical protein